MELGIEWVQTLLKASIEGDDAIADAHPRVLADLHAFVKVMADNRAYCSLAFKDDVLRFTDTAQVRQSVRILNPATTHVEQRDLRGHFLGYLPDSRKAEFVNYRTGERLAASVPNSIRNADSINDILEQPVTLRVRIRRSSTRKPSYTIIGYDPSENDDRSISMAMPRRLITGNRRTLSQGNVDQPPNSSD